MAGGNSAAAFIQAAFETLIAREPLPGEVQACAESLDAWRQRAVERKAADPDEAARTLLVHALMNHTDFVTVR